MQLGMGNHVCFCWGVELCNNMLEGRKTIYDTQLYAYQEYVSGGAFWDAKMLGNVVGVAVNGEDVTEDYWS
jgi:glucan 1,3-beta-glucosidase